MMRPADLGIGLLYWHLRDAVVVGEATSGRVVLWNPAAETLFGYTEDEAVGMPLELLAPERLRPALRTGIATFAETGSGPLPADGTPIQVPARHQDGTEFVVELSLTPLPAAREPGRFALAIIRDATARARQERYAALRVNVAAALTEAGDIDAALQRCAEAMVRHLDAALARVWLLDEAGETLVLRASVGLSPHDDHAQARVPVGVGLIGRIAAERHPVLTTDVPNDPGDFDQAWTRREQVTAFIGCPLLVEGRLLGVIALFSRSALAADDRATLANVASLIAQGVERKQAQAELERERDLFRVLMDHLPDAVYVKDAASRFVRVSQAAATLYGIDDPTDVVGKTDFDVFPAEQAQQFWADERLVLEEGRPLLNRLERQSGEDATRRWTLATKVPLVDGAGHITGLVGISRDITELRRAEEAVRASEERFHAAFAHAAIGMALIGLDGRFLQVNPAFSSVTGYTEEEMLTKTFQDITHPDDLELDLAYVQRLLAGEIPAYQMEKRYVRKDGTINWVRLSASLVRAEDDAPLHFIAQVEDISDRMRMEEQLRHSEARFRSMIGNAKDIISILDPGGDIQYVSPSIQRVLGYDPEDLVGQPAFDLIHPDDREATWAAFAQGVGDPTRMTQTGFRFRHADGAWHWLEATSTNLLADPDVGGLVINSRDVTARKEAEDALRVSEARLAAVLRQIPVGVVIFDAASGTVQMHNQAGDEILGQSGILSSSPGDYARYAGYHLDGSPYRPEENPVARSFLTGEVVLAERLLVKRDEDETIVLEISSAPVHDDQGQIMAAVAVFDDVTQQARAEAEIRRLHAELDVEMRRAAEVQAQLLPQRPPDLPGYAFAGVCVPARQAGGDFFDWQRHPAGVRLALGDVMGKGMPAALLMASVRAALRLTQAMPVAQAVAAVNTTLGPDLEAADSFITLFYADVEPASGTLTYVDAGHGMAFIHHRDGHVETLHQRAWPLGIAPDAQYRGGSVRLAPGETLVLYSDGLPDSRPDLRLDPAGVAAQLTGVDGVEAQLAHLVTLATAGGSPVDDLTLVLVQRLRESDTETSRAGA